MSGTRFPAWRLGGGRVEARVDGQRLAEHLGDVLGGRLLNEPAPGELFEGAHG